MEERNKKPHPEHNPSGLTEEELIARAQGSDASSKQLQQPISDEVAREVVVKDFMATMEGLSNRVHAEPGDPGAPKGRPNLGDRLQAKRRLDTGED